MFKTPKKWVYIIYRHFKHPVELVFAVDVNRLLL